MTLSWVLVREREAPRRGQVSRVAHFHLSHVATPLPVGGADLPSRGPAPGHVLWAVSPLHQPMHVLPYVLILILQLTYATNILAVLSLTF